MFVENLLPTARDRLHTVQANALLTDATKLLTGTHSGLVVVWSANGAMAGVITKSDVVSQVGRCPESACSTTAAEVMTRDVTYCRPGDALHDVLSVMRERGLVHVPVLDQESRPSGVVNARDAPGVLLGEVEDEQSLLRDYVMGNGYR